MNAKPAPRTATVKISFPRKPVVFLDVVVRQFTRADGHKSSSLARLDRLGS